MIRLINAEFLKLRTTRTFYAFLAACALLVLLPTILICALADITSDPIEPLLFFIGQLIQTFSLLIGILAATTEFRHGTITPSLLVVPNRIRLMTSKLLAATLTGLAIGLFSTVLIVVIVAVLGSARDFPTDELGRGGLILGGTLVCGLYAALGVGVGALVRNQVGAIVGALVYVFVIEPLATGLLSLSAALDDILPKYSLGAVANWLVGVSPDDDVLLGRFPAGLLLALYAAIFVAAGMFMLRKRDITA
ncbi:ABC-2 type transport system permease protein [Solirubrobacter pauli]|uniref:ABC-2 type transport system permease protein n=1 Tax=Solirubrobacter pauli TaxID=166793 RepID=A0A660L2X0_9ACTN|nr:ABC transporter permease [Solirubrobacter pauli]RKQ87788.1 ABC-2 type transport system permease protein [Solirubrobacter pauli]